MIVKDINFVHNLDSSTISSLQGNILTLKKYTYEQIFNIISDRVKISVKETVFPEIFLEFIAKNIVESGDIRRSLTIVRNAVKIAELQDDSKIKLEYVKNAMENIIPSLQEDSFMVLNYQQTLLLKSIISITERSKKYWIEITEIKHEYEDIARSNKVEPLAKTQLWENIQCLKENNIIQVEVVSKTPKGRSSIISIKTGLIPIINAKIEERLKSLSIRNEGRH